MAFDPDNVDSEGFADHLRADANAQEERRQVEVPSVSEADESAADDAVPIELPPPPEDIEIEVPESADMQTTAPDLPAPVDVVELAGEDVTQLAAAATEGLRAIAQTVNDLLGVVGILAKPRQTPEGVPLTETIRTLAEQTSTGLRQNRAAIEALKDAMTDRPDASTPAPVDMVPVVEYLSQVRDVQGPTAPTDDFGLGGAMRDIDEELQPTRPGNVSGVGLGAIADSGGLALAAAPTPDSTTFFDDTFMAKVTGSTELQGSGVKTTWSYTCSRVRKTTAGYGATYWTTYGDSFTAYNLCENINDQAGRQGNGVDVAHLDVDGDATNDFYFYPIQTNTPVLVKMIPLDDGSVEFWIVGVGYPNGVDGTCP